MEPPHDLFLTIERTSPDCTQIRSNMSHILLMSFIGPRRLA